MRPRPWAGLLAAGPLSPSLYQFANWNATLGPVCAETLRVASRLANRMKAGVAARPSALGAASLVLISGPDPSFRSLLDLAIQAGVDWSGKTVLLVDSLRGVAELAPLRELGAFTGTLDPIDAFPAPYFFADADPRAWRRIERFASATKSRIFVGDPGGKPAFQAGAALAGSLFAPIFAGAIEAMKLSGLSQPDSLAVASRIVEDTLRAWRKAGRKAWEGTIAPPDITATHELAEKLGISSQTLAAFFQAASQLGSDHFRATNEQNRKHA